MRNALASDNGERKKFHAAFSRFGKKVNYQGYSDRTVLLVNIIDAETNMMVTDHVWFSYTKGFEKLNLKPGLHVAFEARIKGYKKGYVNKKYNINNSKLDYKLNNPTRISIIS
jgi:hypothetical protein